MARDWQLTPSNKQFHRPLETPPRIAKAEQPRPGKEAAQNERYVVDECI